MGLPIRSSDFNVMNKKVSQFVRLVHEYELSERYRKFISILKRFRYLVASSPLPPNAILKFLNSSARPFDAQFKKLKLMDDDRFTSTLNGLEELLEILCKWETNPLCEAMLTQMRSASDERHSILITDSVIFDRTAALLDRFQLSNEIAAQPTLVKINELRAPINCGTLHVFGPTRWRTLRDEEFVFTSGRATRIICYSFDCFPIEEISLSGFAETSKFPRQKISSKRQVGSGRFPEDETESVSTHDLEEILPQTSIDLLKSGHSKIQEDVYGNEEAFLFQLAGGLAVFMGTGSSVNVASWERQGSTLVCSKISHKRAQDLEEGDLVILTTSGGGDMIAPVADKILKEKAPRLRTLQKEWKTSLRIRCFEASSSYDTVAKDLEELGAADASPVNVRNWASFQSIAPAKIETFRTIINYLGLESRMKAFEETVGLLRKAHRSAGFTIARQLKDQILGANVNQLMSNGWQEFRTSEEEGASKTIYIIEQRLAEVHQVSYLDLNKPFPITEDSWA